MRSAARIATAVSAQGGRDDEGAPGQGVRPAVQRGRIRAGQAGVPGRRGAAQPGDLLRDALGGRVVAELVGDGEQCGEVPGQLDVQFLLAGAMGNRRWSSSATWWTDLLRIGSYMGGWPSCSLREGHPILDSV